MKAGDIGLKAGDRVQVNYPVDDFEGHVGIVKEIFEDELGVLVKCYWPFLGKDVCFYAESLDLV